MWENVVVVWMLGKWLVGCGTIFNKNYYLHAIYRTQSKGGLIFFFDPERWSEWSDGADRDSHVERLQEEVGNGNLTMLVVAASAARAERFEGCTFPSCSSHIPLSCVNQTTTTTFGMLG